MSGTMFTKCIEKCVSKPAFLKVMPLAFMIVNSMTTDLGLELLATSTLWYHLTYIQNIVLRIFILLYMADKDLVIVCLWTLGGMVMSSDRLKNKMMPTILNISTLQDKLQVKVSRSLTIFSVFTANM